MGNPRSQTPWKEPQPDLEVWEESGPRAAFALSSKYDPITFSFGLLLLE